MAPVPQDMVIMAMREALTAVKLRICFIGSPNEPRKVDGSVDWEQEITLIELALELANGGA
jgi:hypothetical protein